jgi:hypothetical protein
MQLKEPVAVEQKRLHVQQQTIKDKKTKPRRRPLDKKTTGAS